MATIPSAAAVVGDTPWCFTDEHLDWRETMRRFADEIVAPGAAERAAALEFHLDLVRPIAELGVFGLRVAREYGGSEADITSVCIAMEQLARADASLVGTVQAQLMSCALLDAIADEEQKAEVLPAAVRGELLVAFALTEPQGGSDAGNLKTVARRDGDGWVINGAKQFITNSGTSISRYLLVIAATGPGRPNRPDASIFLVPVDTPGVTVAPGYDKLGWHNSDTHPIFLDDVRVPASALVGREGKGYADTLGCLTWARLPIAAGSLGVAQACLDETLAFLADRQSFGKRLAEHQVLAFDAAEIAADVSIARALTYDGCYKADHGHPYARECAVAKMVASEIANRVAYKATQLHGGYGFINETKVARMYRDARILAIGEGTTHVQTMLLARSLGLPV